MAGKAANTGWLARHRAGESAIRRPHLGGQGRGAV